MKRTLQAIGLVCLAMSGGLSNAEDATFDPRASAVNAILDALPDGDTEAAFTARMSRVRDDFVGTYALREQVQISFSAETDLYLNIAYVDAQGTLTLLQLDLGRGAGRLEGGKVSTFTSKDLETHPPLGLERAYYVATRNPVDQSAFNPEANIGGEANVFASVNPIELAENFVASVMRANSPTEVSTVALDSLVIERASGPRYTSDEIVGFFASRGIFGIDGVMLESGIRFAPGSAVLSEEAKFNLDEWGKAFLHPELAEYRFEIGGYADGSEPGQQLARERAEAALDYLTGASEIREDRFTVVAHGDDAPLVENTVSNDSSASRRVEFYLRID